MQFSGEKFCQIIQSASSRLSLLNSDGYPKSQWQFKDSKSANESYGAIAALSIFLIVDTNRSFYKIAPIVMDNQTQMLFADITQTINVFPDEIIKI